MGYLDRDARIQATFENSRARFSRDTRQGHRITRTFNRYRNNVQRTMHYTFSAYNVPKFPAYCPIYEFFDKFGISFFFTKKFN